MSAETFLDGRVTLNGGDCMDILKAMPDNSIDACVTDPPYHLTSIVKRFGGENAAEAKSGKTGAFRRAAGGFMGKQWDGGDIAFRPDVWREVLRVLKPGGYVLAFASTRGFSRMAVAIEDAGFVAHPMIAYLFDPDPDLAAFVEGLSPEQLATLARLIDRADGGLLGWIFGSGFPKATRVKADGFDGFRYGGQSLKPAMEPIFMGQKPFSEKNGTDNILKHGTGAVNIDGCRVGTEKRLAAFTSLAPCKGNRLGDADTAAARRGTQGEPKEYEGRWPANVVHDGSAAVLAAFPETASGKPCGVKAGNNNNVFGQYAGGIPVTGIGDSGSAARFFYSSKADADDRLGSKHATVKPVDLMRWLVRLVTPPGGVVLDPFAGTGTTGAAAFYEGLSAVLIERENDHLEDIRRRLKLCLAGPDERKRESIKARQDGAPVDAGPLFGGQS